MISSLSLSNTTGRSQANSSPTITRHKEKRGSKERRTIGLPSNSNGLNKNEPVSYKLNMKLNLKPNTKTSWPNWQLGNKTSTVNINDRLVL